MAKSRKAQKIAEAAVRAAGGRRIFFGGRGRFSAVKAVKAEKKKTDKEKTKND